MTEDEIKSAVFEEIQGVAPDTDPTSVAEGEDLRDALDLDSMDMLNIVTALHKRLKIDIPEADAAEFVTIARAVAYLAKRLT